MVWISGPFMTATMMQSLWSPSSPAAMYQGMTACSGFELADVWSGMMGSLGSSLLEKLSAADGHSMRGFNHDLPQRKRNRDALDDNRGVAVGGRAIACAIE